MLLQAGPQAIHFIHAFLILISNEFIGRTSIAVSEVAEVSSKPQVESCVNHLSWPFIFHCFTRNIYSHFQLLCSGSYIQLAKLLLKG